MSTLNSFAICVILLIYPSMIFAGPNVLNLASLPTVHVSLEKDSQEINSQSIPSQIETTSEVSVQKAPNDPPCQQETYKLLLQTVLSNTDLLPKKQRIREDYRYSPNIGMHKLHTRAVPWNEARRICREEGGHLAIINSQEEARIMADMYNRVGGFKDAAGSDEAFVGLHDYFSEGDWVTVLDEPLVTTGFTKWSDKWGGQPDNAGGGGQNCGALLTDDISLDDLHCDSSFPFFCEIPIEGSPAP